MLGSLLWTTREQILKEDPDIYLFHNLKITGILEISQLQSFTLQLHFYCY